MNIGDDFGGVLAQLASNATAIRAVRGIGENRDMVAGNNNVGLASIPTAGERVRTPTSCRWALRVSIHGFSTASRRRIRGFVTSQFRTIGRVGILMHPPFRAVYMSQSVKVFALLGGLLVSMHAATSNAQAPVAQHEIDRIIEDRMQEAGLVGVGAAIIVDKKLAWIRATDSRTSRTQCTSRRIRP